MVKKIKDVLAYITGTLRYKLWYSPFKFLIRTHIQEQITARIASMDSECKEAGECKLCGCQTTALQMANKACDKPCYPKMLGRCAFNNMKEGYLVYDGEMYWQFKDDKFKKRKVKR